MNKSEFLAELQKGLTVLEDGEQKDILEEYSQHIDMKISTGLSEEEAIRDFGSIKELAAQILEAYHVKPEFQGTRQEKEKSDFSRDTVGEKKLWKKLTGSIRSAGGSIKGFCATCFSKGKAALHKLWHMVGIPFRRLGNKFRGKKEETAATSVRKEKKMIGTIAESIQPAQRNSGGIFYSLGRLIAGVFGAVWRCFLWCVRCAWNAFMIFGAFFCCFCTLCLLFFFAVLLVWLTQGFPLMGVTLACFGGVLCFGSLTVLFVTCIVRKKSAAEEENNETADIEEVGHA